MHTCKRERDFVELIITTIKHNGVIFLKWNLNPSKPKMIWILKFHTTCVKQGIVLGGLHEGTFFPTPLLPCFLMCTYLNHLEF